MGFWAVLVVGCDFGGFGVLWLLVLIAVGLVGLVIS